MKFLCSTFLLFLSVIANAQLHYTWDAKVQAVYDAATSFKINEARRLSAIEKKTDPNNLSLQLLDGYADLYQLFFNESSSDYNTVYPQFDKRIDQIKSGPTNTPFYKYSLAVLNFQKAIIAIRFNKNWDAAFAFRRSYVLLKENSNNYPKFTPNNFYFGVLTSVIGAVPSNYQWILNFIGMKGDIQKGNTLVLNYIYGKDAYANMVKNEALLAYPYLVLNLEGNKKKALEFIEKTNYDLKKNHLHAYMATNIYLNNQQPKKAWIISNNIERSNDYLNMPFWNYERGYIQLNQLQLESAKQEYLEFVQSFKGSYYIKDAYEKLSWIAYLQSDMPKAEQYRQKVIALGNESADADKLALENAKSRAWPNATLLKARLLSDGGMQTQSLDILKATTIQNFSLLEDKTEYLYRFARDYDLMEDKDQAMRYYMATIDMGKNLKEYFAARSALQMGLIYEERKDFTNAVKSFHACINMKNKAFKNSLDQKAKAGLLRCEK